MSSMKRAEPRTLGIWRADRKGEHMGQSINVNFGKNVHRAMIQVLVPAVLIAMSVQARSQSLTLSDIPWANESSTAPVKPDPSYVRPTSRITVKNYSFDTLGPYAFAGTVLTASLDQATDTPPEWKQGF